MKNKILTRAIVEAPRFTETERLLMRLLLDVGGHLSGMPTRDIGEKIGRSHLSAKRALRRLAKRGVLSVSRVAPKLPPSIELIGVVQ